MSIRKIQANYVDLFHKTIYPACITITDGKIEQISPISDTDILEGYFMPGFIDAHIHIESSMLIPSQFARMAVRHGTIGTVSDPHEIANVLGMEGIKYMIENGKKVPFKFFFGAPSCVPATTFESAGAEISVEDVRSLMQADDIYYLAEMMNWPGVLYQDPVVLEKIEIAKSLGKPIDGHAPGLSPEEAIRYINAGISTDHECVALDEARHKIAHGMHILIREGSAAQNFEALSPLIEESPSRAMFCSDDKHPHELIEGHINLLVRRSLDKGYDLFNILQAACVNPVLHYHLPVGLGREGDPADFILVDDLSSFEIRETVINGETVFKKGESEILRPITDMPINHFHAKKITPKNLSISSEGKNSKIRVIVAHDKSLITTEEIVAPPLQDGDLVSDPTRDILKLVVYNRYTESKPAICFIKGFGLKEGAIASTIAHDSHNIIAVGTSDQLLSDAINDVIENQGGLCLALGQQRISLPLPVAGLMSNLDGDTIGQQYKLLERKAKETGSSLHDPFMTLSFMALLVIPSLKLSDKGLFDGKAFHYTPLWVE